MMRIAFISTFDSFLRSNQILAQALAPSGIVADHFVMLVRSEQIAADQVSSILGDESCRMLDIGKILDVLGAADYGWVVLSAENTSCRRFFEAFGKFEFPSRRPLVATLYPGILFRHHIDGFSARMPADLVLLNSRSDCVKFRDLRATFGDFPDPAFDLGPITALGCTRMKFEEHRNRVIFFDQPSVPRTREEKTYIFEQLAILAAAHPELDFRVKLRVGPKQSTLHNGGQAAFSTLADFNKSLPAGAKPLELVDGDPRALIAGSRLCLSVSSTALIEALSCGCPAVAITDFGIDEEYGVSFFIGSGITSTLGELDPDHPPEPDPRWVADHVTNPDLRMRDLVSRLASDLALHVASPRSANPIHPFYGSSAFHKAAVNRFGHRRAIERHYRNPRTASVLERIRRYLVKRIKRVVGFLRR